MEHHDPFGILRDFCVTSSAQSCSVRMFGNGRPRQVIVY